MTGCQEPQSLCPICLSANMPVFFEAGAVPVFCNVLWATRDEALAAPKARIRLAHCPRCGLIYNLAFDPSLMRYSANYENSLRFSGRFQQYARQLCASLVERYELRNKDIIEIGCGDGDFLRMLCKVGGNRGLGFDPGCDPAQSSGQDEAVRIVPEAYPTAHASHPADFICCRHVLEHIAQPMEFLRGLRRAIGERRRTVVFFEVPSALHTLREQGGWDILYEHCSYFTPAALSRAFTLAGFEPVMVCESYAGQFVTIEARPAASARRAVISGEEDRCAGKLIDEFQIACRRKAESWRRALEDLRKRRAKAVIWGGGSRGVTFLNVLDVSDQTIRYVVDLNPRKHGKFIPGTGQQVIPPDALVQYRPDLIIIMNAIYRQEIERTAQDLGLGAELSVATR